MKTIKILIGWLLLAALLAQPVLAQTTVYLPLTAGTSTADANHTTTLPICTPEQTNPPDFLPPTELDLSTACRLEVEFFPATEGHTVAPSEIEAANIETSHYFLPKKLQLLRFECTGGSGCNGSNPTNKMRFQITPQTSSLSSGSWLNYFAGSWGAIGAYGYGSGICQDSGLSGTAHIGIGIGQGLFSDAYASSSMHIFAEMFDWGAPCTIAVATGFTISPKSSYIMLLEPNGGCSGGGQQGFDARYWTGTTWAYLLTNYKFSFCWTTYWMVGGEVGAVNSSYSTVIAPPQMIEHVQIGTASGNYLPLQKSYADSTFTGNWTTTLETPLSSQNYHTNDFTSLTWSRDQ